MDSASGPGFFIKMSKDLKIGMIIGVVLLIAATLVISFLSQGSLRSRLKNKYKKDTSTPSVDDGKKNVDDKTPPSNQLPENIKKIHIVEEGQTIYDLADKYYGNPQMIIKIIDENPIPDSYELKTGMKIKIPK
jgi:hypothetical protein